MQKQSVFPEEKGSFHAWRGLRRRVPDCNLQTNRDAPVEKENAICSGKSRLKTREKRPYASGRVDVCWERRNLTITRGENGLCGENLTIVGKKIPRLTKFALLEKAVFSPRKPVVFRKWARDARQDSRKFFANLIAKVFSGS